MLRAKGKNMKRNGEKKKKKKVKRLAVLVRCNYPNTKNELHGCINDVHAMQGLLTRRFGFEAKDIELLTDAHGSLVLPTGANIRGALQSMIRRAKSGDVLFFHYSGHGTRVSPVKPSHTHREGEAIVPCDFNLITDRDFRTLVNQIPQGTSFTMLSDSCHSGGLIDKEKEQIGPSTHSTNGTSSHHHHRLKSIPYESIHHHLAPISGIDSPDVGAHLIGLFGNEASLKFRSSDQGEMSGLLKHPEPDVGILLSGCQANQTSADADPTGDATKAYGAFSNAVQQVMKAHKGVLSSREVVAHAREILHAQGFDQRPCLYCSDENADAPFLCQPN